ncbi:glycosyltransferase [Sphingobacterium detergens]|uniref:glycosyltransferase n=1 Tax=Sphingobacterium detergens TaxID=1145106 RepID=UPI003AABEC82
MNILHIINNLANGGAERLLVDFLPQLKAEHYNITLLVVVESTSLPVYIDELREAGVAVYFLKNSGSLYDIRLPFAINKFLNQGRYDIVHAHLFPTFYYVALVKQIFRRKERYYFTEHSIHNKRIDDNRFKYLEKWIYKSFDKVIVISDAIKYKLDNWIGTTEKTLTIRNGLNLVRLEQASAKDLSTIDGILADLDKKYLLMAARFDHPKRQDLLLEVVQKLPENFMLILAGEGPQLSNCQLLVGQLGISHRVAFLGHRSDIASLMKSVDLNILYSDYEGMSGVTVEALASGKPFLGSDVPGINDVAPSPLNLFKNYQPDEIAEKIINLSALKEGVLLDLQQEQSEKFTMKAMVEGYLRIYQLQERE